METTEKMPKIDKPQVNESVAVQTEIKKARGRAAFSVILNLLLSIGKGTAGILGGSSALIGDAIHSATDVIGSAAAFTGLWLAGKKYPSPFPMAFTKPKQLLPW